MIKKFFYLIVVFLISTTNNAQSKTKFDNDVRVSEIVQNAKLFSSLTLDNREDILTVKNSIEHLVNELKNEYGEENVNNYISENLRLLGGNSVGSNDGDGNKCKRNSNGTVNADDCSFWEMVSYVF